MDSNAQKRSAPDNGAHQYSPKRRDTRSCTPRVEVELSSNDAVYQILTNFQSDLEIAAFLHSQVKHAEKEVKHAQEQFDKLPDDPSFLPMRRQNETMLRKAKEQLEKQREAKQQEQPFRSIKELAELLNKPKQTSSDERSRLDDLERRLHQQSNAIEHLQLENQRFKTVNKELEIRNERLSIEIETARVAMEKLGSSTSAKLEQSQKDIDQLRKESEESYNDCSRKNENCVEHLRSTMEDQRKSIVQLVIKKTATIPALEEHIETIAKIDTDLKLLKQEHRGKKGVNEEDNATISERLENYDTLIEQLQHSVQSKQETAAPSQIQEICNSFSEMMDEVETKIAAVETRTEIVENIAHEAKYNSERFEKKIEDISNIAHEARHIVGDLGKEFMSIKTPIRGFERSMEDVDKRIELVGNDVQEHRHDILDMREKMDLIVNDSHEAIDKFKDIEAQMARFENIAQEVKDVLAKLKTDSYDIENTSIAPLREKITIFERRLNEQHRTPAQHGLPSPPDTQLVNKQLNDRMIVMENQLRFLYDRYNNVTTGNIVSAMCKVFNEQYGFSKVQSQMNELQNDWLQRVHSMQPRIETLQITVQELVKWMNTANFSEISANSRHMLEDTGEMKRELLDLKHWRSTIDIGEISKRSNLALNTVESVKIEVQAYKTSLNADEASERLNVALDELKTMKAKLQAVMSDISSLRSSSEQKAREHETITIKKATEDQESAMKFDDCDARLKVLENQVESTIANKIWSSQEITKLEKRVKAMEEMKNGMASQLDGADERVDSPFDKIKKRNGKSSLRNETFTPNELPEYSQQTYQDLQPMPDNLLQMFEAFSSLSQKKPKKGAPDVDIVAVAPSSSKRPLNITNTNLPVSSRSSPSRSSYTSNASAAPGRHKPSTNSNPVESSQDANKTRYHPMSISYKKIPFLSPASVMETNNGSQDSSSNGGHERKKKKRKRKHSKAAADSSELTPA